MAVKKKEELIASLTKILGETPDDEGVALLEDVNDTIDSMQGDGTNWKEKYEQNDKDWRAKYIARFSGKGDGDDPEPPEDDKPKTPPTFDSLFKGEK